MMEFDIVWNGDAHGPSRGLLADATTVFPTRPAPVVPRGGLMINKARPSRALYPPKPPGPKGHNTRRAYHLAYYHRRRLARIA